LYIEDRICVHNVNRIVMLMGMIEGMQRREPFADISVIGSRAAALFMDGKLVIDNCGLKVKSGQKA